MALPDRQITQLQETGVIQFGAHDDVSLADVMEAVDVLGIDPRLVKVWSTAPIQVAVREATPDPDCHFCRGKGTFPEYEAMRPGEPATRFKGMRPCSCIYETA